MNQYPPSVLWDLIRILLDCSFYSIRSIKAYPFPKKIVNHIDLLFSQSLVPIALIMTISGIYGVNNGDKVNSVIRMRYGMASAKCAR